MTLAVHITSYVLAAIAAVRLWDLIVRPILELRAVRSNEPAEPLPPPRRP